MINSRHTGMIIWIIKILRRLHNTIYKQNALSLAFRQRVGIITKNTKTPEKLVFIELFGGSFLFRGTVMGLKVTVKPTDVLKKGHQRRQTGA